MKTPPANEATRHPEIGLESTPVGRPAQTRAMLMAWSVVALGLVLLIVGLELSEDAIAKGNAAVAEFDSCTEFYCRLHHADAFTAQQRSRVEIVVFGPMAGFGLSLVLLGPSVNFRVNNETARAFLAFGRALSLILALVLFFMGAIVIFQGECPHGPPGIGPGHSPWVYYDGTPYCVLPYSPIPSISRLSLWALELSGGLQGFFLFSLVWIHGL